MRNIVATAAPSERTLATVGNAWPLAPSACAAARITVHRKLLYPSTGGASPGLKVSPAPSARFFE